MSEELHQDNIEETGSDAEAVDPYQSFREERMQSWREGDAPIIERAEFERRSYQSSLENMQHFAEQFERRAETLRTDIEEKKSGLLSRILHFKKIRDLEVELGVTEHQHRATLDLAREREELVALYGRIIEEEHALGALMEEAQKENEEWDEEKRREVLEEEGKRDLGRLSARHDTFFVHSIVESINRPSGDNEVLDTKQLGVGDQFDILLGLQPTISVSTLDRGADQETFFNKSWGVFLSGGRVTGGARADAFTKATGLRERVIEDRFKSTEAIEVAISERDGEHHYNELVVERPHIAGMYFKWDEGEEQLKEEEIVRVDGDDGDAWWEKAHEAMKRNVPIFLMTGNNRARMAYDIDPNAKTFKVAAEMRPQDMVDLPGIYKQHTGEYERRKAVARVFDKVTGVLSEEERVAYAPDGTEHTPSDSPYRLHQ